MSGTRIGINEPLGPKIATISPLFTDPEISSRMVLFWFSPPRPSASSVPDLRFRRLRLEEEEPEGMVYEM
jgi:hypothetical protein